MVTIFIDNKPYNVKKGDNLLHACLDLGFDIPYFCWHPAMHSVGACRLCAVKQFKDENDTRGRIIMSCMTPVSDNMRISIDDPEVREFRAGIIELLMINHPHDCPVCDEGGECHLQDMTLMTGHVYRRSRFKKRTYRNQYLGPFLNHEMNRCIHCYRCVRFYRDYAGGRDLEAFASHHHVYFGRHKDGDLENVFSGNLAEICPTGVFTDKTFKRHFTRKWDLQTAPSVCVHCGLGCNTIPGERYGMLRRVSNRYNREVNGYFLCDRGRFGYEFVNHDKRIRKPVLGKINHSVVSGDPGLSKRDVLNRLSHILRFGASVIGIGSPRSSVEANYALRTLVGPDNFYSGISETEFVLTNEIIKILMQGPVRSPSLHDIAMSDAVLILGEDVQNTAPLMALVLRQSVRNGCMELVRSLGIPEWNDTFVRLAMQEKRSPLFIATPDSTGIDDIAERTFRAAPNDIARLGFEVANLLDSNAPQATGLGDASLSLANVIAGALKNAKNPVIISGTSCNSAAVIQAAANIAYALSSAEIPASLCFTMPACNSLGLGLMKPGNIQKAFKAAASGMVETAIILENDLYRSADTESVNGFLNNVSNVIAIDALENRTTSRANIVLPAATFSESTGTFINNEGRAQRFFKVFVPEGIIEESWRWLCDMLSIVEREEGEKWKTVHDIILEISGEFSVFRPLPSALPSPEFRETGQKIPRQSHRYSGRTAMTADKFIHEPEPPGDNDSPLSFSMEGYGGRPPSSLITRYWAPGWNSVQSLNKFQSEVGGPLKGGDPGQRLIEPSPSKERTFFDDIPGAFKARGNEFLIVPLYRIFGSDELSVLSPGISELSPEPYLTLNAKDAAAAGIENGDNISLSIDGVLSRRSLQAKISPELPHGVAGFPLGLPSLEWINLPEWGKVSKTGGGQ